MAVYAELVHYQRDRGIGRIELDSPHNRNALSRQLTAELGERLAEASSDPRVRAIQLTHTGPVFCAGADLSEMKSGVKSTDSMIALLRAIVEAPKPVVATLDGHVRAGGLGLVGAADIVLTGRSCSFAFSEVRIGVAPAMIALTTMGRMSERAVSRYYLTGEKFDAATAARAGLITEVVDDVTAAAEALFDELRLCSPQALAACKPVTTQARRAAFDAQADELAAMSARLFNSGEAKEGMLAFLEKRSPSWAVEYSSA
ncbi:enoyl-CoA hydratase family protein [Mycobacteroides immunogenum]|uniref:Enoyl-CoA hydratase n=1 Tax=Mycobacteroides immunogenum TaxID=83262 RepID=A0A7V8RYL1_9MYCO|nr:enoyl-CoA hydratase family protein [Mycobacteroides immunogenum]AMT73274.1 enoyl-CoA hydratase [Mycobacteroides immunogenum]ANO06434.1 enoyl-CoA hydratase [Mycobacteroides immunogenum]KIU39763.1 enoyl-CoA hydratase [Mycobacteroides immunogenum]KPG10668.1 enoyl-CoA hydratase [Mycobacteroides immunogenum]KPG12805.1 enoyl-CoA hydratase [Mycobacteroides immunogenum]